jgi:membrane protease YdiL (CAAX protease family)
MEEIDRMKKGRWTVALTALVGSAILIWLFRFNQLHPVDDDYLVTNFAALLWIPLLLIFLIFKEEPSTFGFQIGDMKTGYRWAGVLFLLLLPFMIHYANDPAYQHQYPMNPIAKTSLYALCRFELLYGVYLFCWEFFFRGFLQFGLARSLGGWSVFAQAIPFGIMHYGKPEFAGSFFSGIILGALALKSKSFMPCFVLHWAISLTFDILVIHSTGVRLF